MHYTLIQDHTHRCTFCLLYRYGLLIRSAVFSRSGVRPNLCIRMCEK